MSFANSPRNRVRRMAIVLSVGAAVFSFRSSPSFAGPPLPPPTIVVPTSTAPPRLNFEESLSSIVRQLVIDSLPRQYTDDKNWGKTTNVVNGLKIEHDGDGLKIRKHTHEVNDGLWKEYRAELVDPNKELRIRVDNVHSSGPNQTSLQLFLAARLHGQARLEQWKDGVKLLNLNTEAECKIEARLDMDVRWRWEPGSLFGEMTVEPKVTRAELRLVDFDLQKVSKLQGWAARELGDGLKHTIAKQLQREEPKLVEKINSAIQKKQSHLHFSPDAAVTNGLSKLESLFHLDDANETPAPQAAH
jgi:hypothetical protein